MWPDLIRALALVAVIEGLAPFIAPDSWRETVMRLADIPPRQIRIVGAALIALGIVVLQFVHYI